MEPKFNTDFEYDEWFEEKDKQKILDNYFGKNWEVENGDNNRTN